MDGIVVNDWPIWAIILYLFIKDGIPTFGNLFERVAKIVIPARSKQAATAMEFEKELEARRIDLREREVVALEQIAKSLIVIDMRLQTQDKSLSTLISGISIANNALVVVLDRVHRRRENYEPTTNTQNSSQQQQSEARGL